MTGSEACATQLKADRNVLLDVHAWIVVNRLRSPELLRPRFQITRPHRRQTDTRSNGICGLESYNVNTSGRVCVSVQIVAHADLVKKGRVTNYEGLKTHNSITKK